MATPQAGYVDMTQGGITGESALKQGMIDMLNCSFSMHNPGSGSIGSGSGTSRAEVSDIFITKYTDMSSSALFKACASGKTIGNVTITLFKASGGSTPVNYLQLILTEAFVSGFTFGVSNNGELATETYHLNAKQIGYNYTEQQASGDPGATATANYNIATNTVS